MFTLKAILYFTTFLMLIFILAKAALTIADTSSKLFSKINAKRDAIECSLLLQQSHYNLTQPNQGLKLRCSKVQNSMVAFGSNEFSMLVTPECINEELSTLNVYPNGHYK